MKKYDSYYNYEQYKDIHVQYKIGRNDIMKRWADDITNNAKAILELHDLIDAAQWHVFKLEEMGITETTELVSKKRLEIEIESALVDIIEIASYREEEKE